METETLFGQYTIWTLCDKSRTYGTVQNLPFNKAKSLIMPFVHNGATGRGQQRETVKSHVTGLKSEMRSGVFTPTPVSAALEDKHRSKLKLDPDPNEGFALDVDSQNPLSQTDGGHRFAALCELSEELKQKAGSKNKDEAEKAARWLSQVDNLPITVTLYFDGDPKRDFLNLQAGRSVDRSHMLSLAIQTKRLDDPAAKKAVEIARILNKDEESPFRDQIKFDSRGNKFLPLSTICSLGGSDIGTSLVGLARVGKDKSAEFLAGAVTAAFQTLVCLDDARGDDVGILEYGKALTPVANDGTRGSSTMLTGLGVCLAHRLIAQGREQPDQSDLDALSAAAESALNRRVVGSFSGATKRELLGGFAKAFFSDVECEKHEGIPLELVKALSASTFAVGPLPKAARTPGKRKTDPSKVAPWEEPAGVAAEKAEGQTGVAACSA